MAAESPEPTHNIRGFAAGVVAGALFALGLYVLAKEIQPDSGLILLSVLLIPVAASALAAIVANIRGEKIFEATTKLAVAVVSVLLAGSAVIFHEGAICIVMAAPLFVPLGILGALAAAKLRSLGHGRTPPAMVVLLPLLLLPLEQQSAYPAMNQAVVSSIEIDAPLETVWRNAVEIRDIAPSEQTWTATHNLFGVPRPVDARLVAGGDGPVREATWAGDVRFYEIITDRHPLQSITWRFDIPEAAADRVLDEHLRLDEGYLRLQAGRYDLEALTPTRTRITLTTHYYVRTPFNAYARAWGELLLGDIHRNVLNIVRQRAERDGAVT